MNVRQYQIMFDAFEVCRQIVYENENGISFGIYLAKGESKIYVPV